MDANIVCFTVTALPVLSVTVCPSPLTDTRILCLVQLPALTPCSRISGKTTLINDPIQTISSDFATLEAGESVMRITVGASFGHSAVLLTGAAGDTISGLRVKAVVIEPQESSDLSEGGTLSSWSVSWQKSSRVLLRGEWSLLSNASGIALMPEPFGVDWLLSL